MILEFVDLQGAIASTLGVSYADQQEFWDRYNLICTSLSSSGVSAVNLYRTDTFFKQNCDRILHLNGISPDQLDGSGVMLLSLLVSHDGNLPLLVQLNTPETKISIDTTNSPEEKQCTIDEAIASIWLIEGWDATQRIISEPACRVRSLLSARSVITERQSEGASNSKTNKPKGFDDWADKYKQNPNKTIDLSKILKPEELKHL